MKIYRGERLGKREELPPVSVTVEINEAKIVDLEHHVRHSPTGFEWGYGGSGPADLALSILWDFHGKEPGKAEYMRFKEQFVSGWGDKWYVTEEEISNWLKPEAECAGA